MTADRITRRRLAAGTILFTCGTVQVAAGIVLIILLSTVLRTASNIWTGAANVALGIVLISSFNKKSYITTACIGTTVLNSVNLFILELLEWEKFITQNEFKHHLNDNFILQVTTIPSIIVLFLAFLACQDLCWTSIMRKRFSQNSEKISSLCEEPSDFNWVFREAETWQTNYSHCIEEPNEFQTSLTAGADYNNVAETSLNNSNASLTTQNVQSFTPKLRGNFNDCTPRYSIASLHSEQNLNAHYTTLPTFHERILHSASHASEEDDILPIILNRRSLMAMDQHSSSKTSHLQRSKSDIKTRTGTANSTNIHKSNTYTAFNKKNVYRQPASPPRPFDKDSLVHLKRLELLARQWRFHAQHKALTRQFSFQIAERNYTTRL